MNVVRKPGMLRRVPSGLSLTNSDASVGQSGGGKEIYECSSSKHTEGSRKKLDPWRSMSTTDSATGEMALVLVRLFFL
jgi:hypothetical protein